jgi:hypothetical protein
MDRIGSRHQVAVRMNHGLAQLNEPPGIIGGYSRGLSDFLNREPGGSFCPGEIEHGLIARSIGVGTGEG